MRTMTILCCTVLMACNQAKGADPAVIDDAGCASWQEVSFDECPDSASTPVDQSFTLDDGDRVPLGFQCAHSSSEDQWTCDGLGNSIVIQTEQDDSSEPPDEVQPMVARTYCNSEDDFIMWIRTGCR